MVISYMTTVLGTCMNSIHVVVRYILASWKMSVKLPLTYSRVSLISDPYINITEGLEGLKTAFFGPN